MIDDLIKHYKLGILVKQYHLHFNKKFYENEKKLHFSEHD